MKKGITILSCALIIFLYACQQTKEFDVLIMNGTVYNGSGEKPIMADIGINSDTIVQIGDLSQAKAKKVIDATGKSVSPGFINMLSWATESLIYDSRSMSDILQGITLEVMGEGVTMGPINDSMKKASPLFQADLKFEYEWETLGEYLEYLENKGVAPNVASMVGATSVRMYELGEDDVQPTEEQMTKMKALVRQAMEEGAMGVGSSLIYAPASYATIEELIELCKVAAEYDGMYISHMRSEGDYWLEAIDELLAIADGAKIDAEIYHLKAAGKDNWHKWETAIAKIDSARAAGLNITTNMYTYTAGATGLDAAMPTWVQNGGFEKWAERLKDPKIRARVKKEMKDKGDGWENLYHASRGGDNMIFVAFKNKDLRKYAGMTLKEVSELLNKDPEDVIMDLVIEDGSRVGTVYYLMSEENVRKQIKLPYMSFGSDGPSIAPEPPVTNTGAHPRSYGNFARLLRKYVREEKVIPMEEAIYKLTSLPAKNLKIKKRGALKEGYFADVVIFDPETISDKATFKDPHQLSVGVEHVFVNGEQVIENGEHTGATPGRVVRGPGWKGWKK